MKLAIACFALCLFAPLFTSAALATNIVPNGDFELSPINCPYAGTILPTPWYSFKNSPDLVSEGCAPSEKERIVTTTPNGTNWIFLRSHTSGQSGRKWNEGIAVKLDAPMVVGFSYEISFKAGSRNYPVRPGMGSISVHLSETTITESSPGTTRQVKIDEPAFAWHDLLVVIQADKPYRHLGFQALRGGNVVIDEVRVKSNGLPYCQDPSRPACADQPIVVVDPGGYLLQNGQTFTLHLQNARWYELSIADRWGSDVIATGTFDCSQPYNTISWPIDVENPNGEYTFTLDASNCSHEKWWVKSWVVIGETPTDHEEEQPPYGPDNPCCDATQTAHWDSGKGLRAYPNPFNPKTTISFTLNEPADTRVAIFDIKGKLVHDFGTTKRNPGQHSLTWNGETTTGSRATSGVYYARVGIGTDMRTVKLVLLK